MRVIGKHARSADYCHGWDYSKLDYLREDKVYALVEEFERRRGFKEEACGATTRHVRSLLRDWIEEVQSLAFF